MSSDDINIDVDIVRLQIKKMDREGVASRLEFLAGKIRREKLSVADIGMVSVQDNKLIVERIKLGAVDKPKKSDVGKSTQSVITGIEGDDLTQAYKYFVGGVQPYLNQDVPGLLTYTPHPDEYDADGDYIAPGPSIYGHTLRIRGKNTN